MRNDRHEWGSVVAKKFYREHAFAHLPQAHVLRHVADCHNNILPQQQMAMLHLDVTFGALLFG